MSLAALRAETVPDLISVAQTAAGALETILAEAISKVRTRVTADGKIAGTLFDREQRATHGLAWLATYADAVRQLGAWAERMSDEGRLGEIEELVVRIGLGEYIAQVAGGIPMSQGEFVRPTDLGLDPIEVMRRLGPSLDALATTGNTPENRAKLAELISAHHTATPGDCGLDETLEQIRDEMRKFADSEVIPFAHKWHLTNSYIPLETIQHVAELGVFGLTLPEE
ncbi:MAG: acyl-CoA dehydrogenase family protein, partial [Xanthobacteraceae bacterium]